MKSQVRDITDSVPAVADRGDFRQLKVLLLNYEFPPSGGGAGNATYQTALQLSKRGHHVDVLTARLPNQPTIDKIGSLTIHRVWSCRRGIHESGLLGAAAYLVTALARLRTLVKNCEYDLFHFYFGLPTGLLGLYVRFRLKKPYLISLRGSDVPGYDRTRWYLQPLHMILRPISRYLWARAASVVALSGHLRSLAKLTAPDLDIKVVGNAVDAELFPKRPDRITPRPIRLICVCRLVKRKGLQFLIQAMSELADDTVLEIIGEGDREEETRALLSKYSVADRVTLTGYVPRDCLADRYHSADIFVLPSLSESFGQVLLEAMSCGLPIIASRVGGIPETIQDGTNGILVEPASAVSLAIAIRRLASNPSLRNEIGSNNACRVRTHYSWDSIANAYEELYQEALDERSIASQRPA